MTSGISMAVHSEVPAASSGIVQATGGLQDGAAGAKSSAADIIDIRQAVVEMSIKDEISSMFSPKEGPRRLPTLLLYSREGLQIYEDVTYLDEYYLINREVELLEESVAGIAKEIPDGAMVIELGSGNLRKVNLLLEALDRMGKAIDYYALDLSKDELERTLALLPTFDHIRCHGLFGTYDDGREWLKQPSHLARPKCILSLGSSIGNFERGEATEFLRGFADVLSPNDTMLIGLDGCNNSAQVYHAYNDRKGVTHDFILHGLIHANQILGQEAFKIDDWRVVGEYVYDEHGARHRAFYTPKRDTVVMGETIRAHERIQVEQSFKYSDIDASRLWESAGMRGVRQWKHRNDYGLHLLARPKMPFSPIPSVYSKTPLPALEDWHGLWAAWDLVTRGMLPDEELQDHPIRLRNACIFYLGHIPTFFDIQITKATKEPPTDPSSYHRIFERGIDPDVDNPEKCHDHSEIPDEWPPLEEILAYQARVRSRLEGLYAIGQGNIPRNVGRAIWIGFEHEIMHLETLLYMMLQSEKTLPPPHVRKPDFESLAATARKEQVPNKWFDVPAQTLTVGLDDPEDSSDTSKFFGWDNEKPTRELKVHSFQAQGRPITNEEYARYLHDAKMTTIPASWVSLEGNGKFSDGSNGISDASHASNGDFDGQPNGNPSLPESFLEDKSVRTFYGLVPLKYALDWPVFASYDELAGCASWMGGRIPTFEEARSIYHHVDALKRDEAERKLGKTVPAVNGHLVNDGVEETPPSRTLGQGDGGSGLFIDLLGANVGFQHWHPVSVTAHGDRLAGQTEMGGVWEWTSSPLRKWDGFEPLSLYPGYTADFFDDKHNIILGGSWATHPRIAGRKSFVNWYQRNYLYAWAGARLVRDAQ